MSEAFDTSGYESEREGLRDIVKMVVDILNNAYNLAEVCLEDDMRLLAEEIHSLADDLNDMVTEAVDKANGKK